MNIKGIATALALALLLPLAASAAEDANGDTPDEAALRERVNGYWEAKMARITRVYQYYLPEEKGGMRLGNIAEGGAVQYKDYKITDIEIDGDNAVVSLDVVTQLSGPNVRGFPSGERDVQIRHRWLRFEDEWYKEPVRRGFRIADEFQREKEEFEKKNAEERKAAIEATRAMIKARENIIDPATSDAATSDAEAEKAEER